VFEVAGAVWWAGGWLVLASGVGPMVVIVNVPERQGVAASGRPNTIELEQTVRAEIDITAVETIDARSGEPVLLVLHVMPTVLRGRK